MPIGCFYVDDLSKTESPKKEVRKAPVKEIKPKQVDFAPAAESKSFHLKVLLLGRSQKIMREYICSMYKNLTDDFIGTKLSVFTKNQGTLTEIIETENEINRYFRDNNSSDRILVDETEKSSENYSVEIGIAGQQDVSLSLDFTCVTDGAGCSAAGYQAAWILLDAELTDKSGSFFGGYDTCVKSFLSSLDSKKIPVSLIASQFENLERYSSCRTFVPVSTDARNEITQRVKEKYAECFGEKSGNVFLLFSQVYGGFAFSGTSGQGDIIQNIGSGRSFYDYRPLACHSAVLMTVKFMLERRMLPDSAVVTEMSEIYKKASFLLPYWNIEL